MKSRTLLFLIGSGILVISFLYAASPLVNGLHASRFLVNPMVAKAKRTMRFDLQTFSCRAVTEIPTTECEVLVTLFNRTNGPSWYDHTNWLVTTTPCSWFGIRCSNHHITELNLGENELRGDLPFELYQLTKLTTLSLNDNQLSGEISPSIGLLTNLQTLDFYGNNLIGTIPAQLALLTSLTELSLGYNELSGTVPSQLGQLINLTNLTLNHNQLMGGLPRSFTQLTKLDFLQFENTELCESIDAAFQAWLASVAIAVGRTGVVCSDLKLVNLKLEPAAPRVGEPFSVRFEIENSSGQEITVGRIGVGLRGPDACKFANPWDAPKPPETFDGVDNQTFPAFARREFVSPFKGAKGFEQPGVYILEPVYVYRDRFPAFQNSKLRWFNVLKSDGSRQTPNCLVIVEPLTISPPNPKVGEMVQATFKIQNKTDHPIVFERLNAAGRRGIDWSGANADFPDAPSNLTLQSGESYTYFQSKIFAETGDYFAEPWRKEAGEAAKYYTGGIWGGNRVTFQVTASPANVVLEDVSIKIAAGRAFGPDADFTQLFLYEEKLTVTALRSNSIWLKVFNRGGQTFVPPAGSGQYTIQITLKKGETVLSTQEFSSHETYRIPLYSIAPGKSQPIGPIILKVALESLQQGTLEITFIPDPTLGIAPSKISKPITINDFSEGTVFDCAVSSVAFVLKPIAGDLSDTVPGELLEPMTSTVAACKNGDIPCLLKQMVTWAATAWLKLFGSVGDRLNAAIESLQTLMDLENQYHVLGEKGCFEAAAWWNAYTSESNQKGSKTNSILVESPVYPLVINNARQRAGFLLDGQIVEEIPDSRAALSGEKRVILYPGQDPVDLQFTGYKAGRMNLHIVLYQADATEFMFSYENVQVIEGMRASLTSTDACHLLEIDTNGDGIADRSLSPDKIQKISLVNYLYLPLITNIFDTDANKFIDASRSTFMTPTPTPDCVPQATPTQVQTNTTTPIAPTATHTPTFTPTPSLPPAAPSNLRTTVLDANRIQLEWQDNASNETGFTIYEGGAQVAQTVANTTSYTVAGLAPTSYHCFQIYAFNGYGNSPASEWACATTGGLANTPTATTVPPTNTPVLPTATDTPKPPTNTPVAPTGTNTPQPPPPTFTPTFTPVSTPTATPGQPPAAPNNLQATALDTSRVRLTWRDNANNETGFAIYDGDIQVATVNTNTSTYTVQGLAPGSYHCFHLYAFNNFGASAWTDWACVVTLTPTNTPTNTPTSTPTHTPTPTPDPCPRKAEGDADCDGNITIGDYEIWRKEYNGTLTTKTADFNRDGVVDMVDFAIWQAHYLG